MTVKSRLSRKLRVSRRNRARWNSHLSRSRDLRLETLEDRCMLTGITSLSGMGPINDGPEGEGGGGNEYVSGELIVEFAAGTSDEVRDVILQQENATLIQDFYGLDYAWIRLSSEDSMEMEIMGIDSIINHWESLALVEAAEANVYVNALQTIPNDPLFPLQWDMNNNGLTGGFIDADIDAPEAWDIFTGSSETVVAIIDTGIDYLHTDLRDNMWQNPGEIPGDGIDNDLNGYIDDVFGIAPINGPTATDPMDGAGHGTHVAGTVGATGNNGIGISGVNWDVQLMAVKILDDTGTGSLAASVAGITYVTMMREQFGINVLVSNNSWGTAPGVPGSPLERAAIEAHINSGILFVAAAGNDDNNNDILPSYPASFDLDGIVSVAATSHFDLLSSYSNFGQLSVDLAAPGGDGADNEVILSTWPPGVDPFAAYNQIQGTSMASPHVAGVAALIRGLAPEFSVLQTKQLLLDSVDPLPWLDGVVLSGGRLNAANALESIFSTQVEGKIWRDDNGNGARDVGEPGLSNWTAYLDLDDSGTLDVDEPFAVTDANGDYSIDTFEAPGDYTLREVLKPRWEQTFPTGGAHSITIAQRGDVLTGLDFGNKPFPGSVTGFKWHDIDGDGIRDPGEPGQGGVWIYADLDDNGIINLLEPAAITAADGSYAIHDIPAGEVAIRESLPLGWATTYPALGYHIVDVVPATTISNIDFGNFASFDYGDAPAAAGYPTLAADGGAFHGITPGYQLGALIDAEDDGLPSPTAVGDDLDNLQDEDGVVIDGAFFQGATDSVAVTIETSGFPRGYLQGWIDFNADGDWNDPGEQIATNLRLGTGTYDVSFTVPSGADVVVGGSFARFRYGLEIDLGPTGGSTVGEVEDYAVLILKDEPVANPDNYEIQQDSINNSLSVLDNDFPSSTGVLTITAVTQPDNGTVSIAPGGQTVIFTPDFGFFSPPNEVFSYTIDDGTGKTDSATVTVIVRPELVAPVAVDDVFRVAAGSGANDLDVLANDLTGILGTMQLISVTAPGSGTATIDNNGTADPLDDFIVYTPDGTFDRGDQFEYTVSNLNGLSTATVTVFESPTPSDLGVNLGIGFEDLFGSPIDQVNVDDEFVMVVSIQDVRSGVTAADMGMFSAFLDVLYDRSLVLPVVDPANPVGVEITYSPDYSNALDGAEGDASTPGLLNEVGSFTSSFTPLGPSDLEVFRVNFTANAAGVAEFLGDPADVTPLRDVVYFVPPSAAPYTDINYNIAALTIIGAGGEGDGEGENLDVNADGYVSPIDALLVVSHLNSGNSTSSGSSSTFNPRLDVNRDRYVSPLDALLVISYLNGGAGEGEGEGGNLTIANTGNSNTAPVDLLASDPVLVLGTIDAPTNAPIVTASQTPQTATTAASSITQDWLLQIGEKTTPPTTVDPATVTMESWDSLLDTLAEDVLEAWFDGEDA